MHYFCNNCIPALKLTHWQFNAFFCFQVCIITAEMWCLFKKSKYSSTKLKNLGYLPQLEYVQKFWKLCEQQLNISGYLVTCFSTSNLKYLSGMAFQEILLPGFLLITEIGQLFTLRWHRRWRRKRRIYWRHKQGCCHDCSCKATACWYSFEGLYCTFCLR